VSVPPRRRVPPFHNPPRLASKRKHHTQTTFPTFSLPFVAPPHPPFPHREDEYPLLSLRFRDADTQTESALLPPHAPPPSLRDRERTRLLPPPPPPNERARAQEIAPRPSSSSPLGPFHWAALLPALGAHLRVTPFRLLPPPFSPWRGKKKDCLWDKRAPRLDPALDRPGLASASRPLIVQASTLQCARLFRDPERVARPPKA
jgi:hypothetical protein